MSGLFMPYDHVGHIPDHPSSAHTLRILREINTQACESKCAVGSGGKQVGYLAHGTATDYMYEKANVSIAMTWEIYGDESADYKDCFKMFNPLTQAGYDAILTAWTNALFVLLLEVQQHPDVAHLVFPSPQGSQQGLSGDAVTLGTKATELTAGEEQLAHDSQELGSSNRSWVVLDGRRVEQQQAVLLRLVAVMFIMTIVLWFATKAFLARRKRLAKAAGGSRGSR
jgi:hypothetical protein